MTVTTDHDVPSAIDARRGEGCMERGEGFVGGTRLVLADTTWALRASSYIADAVARSNEK